ncbi:hypothetical protein D3C78_1361910 [compost metagenome]
MIFSCLNAPSRKLLIYILDLLARGRIYNARLLPPLSDILLKEFLLINTRYDRQREIRSGEAGNEYARFTELKHIGNILSDFICCCSSKRCNKRPIRHSANPACKLAVARAKIMSPLRYTVGFVDGNQWNLKLL